jgi:hypothetical protein
VNVQFMLVYLLDALSEYSIKVVMLQVVLHFF